MSAAVDTEKPLYCDACLLKQLNSQPAKFLCFDCELYLCFGCTEGHSRHFIYKKDDNDTQAKVGDLYSQMLRRIQAEGDEKRSKFMQNDYHVTEEISLESRPKSRVSKKYVLHKGKTVVLCYFHDKSLTLFDISHHTVKRKITFTSGPYGVTDIEGGFCGSPHVIAVTFPFEKQILILDIDTRPASILHVIETDKACSDILHHDGIFVTLILRQEHWDDRCTIMFIDATGKVINSVSLNLQQFQLNISLPDYNYHFQPFRFQRSTDDTGNKRIVVLELDDDKLWLTEIDMNGRILRRLSTSLSDYKRMGVVGCAGSSQNVYVARDYPFQLYKLSNSLRVQTEITHQTFERIGRVLSAAVYEDTFYIYHFQDGQYRIALIGI